MIVLYSKKYIFIRIESIYLSGEEVKIPIIAGNDSFSITIVKLPLHADYEI